MVLLDAGAIVPADSRIVVANHLFVDQGAQTGESAPAAKAAATTTVVPEKTCASACSAGGSGRAGVLVTATGARSTYGAIARRLEREPATDFQQSVRAFGFP